MRGLSFRRTEPAGSLVFRYAPESGLQLREPCRSDRIRSKERAGPAAVPVEAPIRTVQGESFFGLLLRWKTFGSPRCDILLARLSLPRRSTSGLHPSACSRRITANCSVRIAFDPGKWRVPVVGTLSVGAGPGGRYPLWGLPFASADSCVVGVYCSKYRDRGCLPEGRRARYPCFEERRFVPAPSVLQDPETGFRNSESKA